MKNVGPRWLTLIYLGQSETSLWSIKPFSKHRRTKVRRRREINWYISHSARRARTPFPLCSSSIKMLRILLFNFIAYTRETISKLFRIFCHGERRKEGGEKEEEKGEREVCTYQWDKSQRSRHSDSHLYCYKWHGSQFASDPIAGGIRQTKKRPVPFLRPFAPPFFPFLFRSTWSESRPPWRWEAVNCTVVQILVQICRLDKSYG